MVSPTQTASTESPGEEQEAKVYEALRALGIPFTRHEHPAVFTVEEAERHWAQIRATHCKNLFLRNQKGNRHFLVVLRADKRADLKAVAAAAGEDRLSFASAERLSKCLGLVAGSVSPFGLLNDASRTVQVILDQDLRAAASVAFHPNVNTATIVISFADFERFLASRGNLVKWVRV
ncbi:MAG: prolyl-tRNA synthetase associated domain-containing protein [Vicinamibacterales bacterium]